MYMYHCFSQDLFHFYQVDRVAGLKIATDTVANVTNISPLATKHSGLVAILATIFRCVDDE